MKTILLFSSLLLSSILAIADSPIIRNNFTTNAPTMTSAQVSAGVSDETGSAGSLVFSISPKLTGTTLVDLLKGNALTLTNSFQFLPGAATGFFLSDTTGLASISTNVPSHSTTNIVATGTLSAATANATTGAFNTLKMTNGAAAATYAVGDASGNITFSTSPPSGSFTNASVTSGSPVAGSIAISTNTTGGIGWTTASGSSPNIWWLKNLAWRDYQAFSGASAGASSGLQSGTFSAGSSVFNTGTTNMTSIDLTTTTSSNNTVGFFTEQAFSAAANNQMAFVVVPTNVTNIRFFCGIARAVSQSTMVATDVPGVDAAGFHYVNNGAVANSNWQYMTCDNSTTSESDTGVTASSTPTVFYVIGNDGGTSWDFYINNALIGTKIVNTPRSSQAYEIVACLSTQTTTVKCIRIFLIKGRTRSVIPP